MFSALSVVTPPAVEPVSVQLVKRHTRIDFDDDDELLAPYITAARTWVEQYLGRVLIAQQLTWVIAREMPRNGYPMLSMPLTLLILPLWFQWPFAQRGALELPRQPVISVDAVSFGQWGQANSNLVVGTDYDVDIASARLLIRPNSEVIPNDHLSVTFTAGYGASGAAVPQTILQAIMLLTAFFYENRGDSSAEKPAAAEMLLAPHRLVTFG